MNALTLWQPWASLIASGHKTIETRSWRPPTAAIGKQLAIHAGKDLGHIREIRHLYESGKIPQLPDDLRKLCEATYEVLGINTLSRRQLKVPTGQILAVVRLVGFIGPTTLNLHTADQHQLTAALLGTDVTPKELEEQTIYGDFYQGRYGWILRHGEKLEHPYTISGKQRLWNLSPEDSYRIREQLMYPD